MKKNIVGRKSVSKSTVSKVSAKNPKPKSKPGVVTSTKKTVPMPEAYVQRKRMTPSPQTSVTRTSQYKITPGQIRKWQKEFKNGKAFPTTKSKII